MYAMTYSVHAHTCECRVRAHRCRAWCIHTSWSRVLSFLCGFVSPPAGRIFCAVSSSRLQEEIVLESVRQNETEHMNISPHVDPSWVIF